MNSGALNINPSDMVFCVHCRWHRKSISIVSNDCVHPINITYYNLVTGMPVIKKSCEDLRDYIDGEGMACNKIGKGFESKVRQDPGPTAHNSYSERSSRIALSNLTEEDI